MKNLYVGIAVLFVDYWRF